MEDNTSINKKAHKLILNNRRCGNLTGVSDVLSFDENEIILETDQGMLMMKGKEETCAFLTEEGRCCIHDCRPGICRMFPLGRYYEEDGSFHYFLQSQECPKENKTKVKVSKWLGIPNLKKYEAFIGKWHGLLEEVRDLTEKAKDEQLTKELTVYLLNTCYLTVYKENVDFYDQFEERYHRMKKLLQVLKQKKES